MNRALRPDGEQPALLAKVLRGLLVDAEGTPGSQGRD
jgi:hypothetical protein